MNRYIRPTILALCGALSLLAHGTVVGDLKLVGYTSTPSLGFHRLAVGQSGDRWCLIAEGRGASVIDITDPANPKPGDATCPASTEHLTAAVESKNGVKPLHFVVSGHGSRSYVVHGTGLRVLEGATEIGSFHAPRQWHFRPTPSEIVVDPRGFIYYSQGGGGLWVFTVSGK